MGEQIKNELNELIKNKKLKFDDDMNYFVPVILVHKVIQDMEEEVTCLVEDLENVGTNEPEQKKIINASIDAYSDAIGRLKDIIKEGK